MFATAFANEPGRSALGFLEKVRDGEIDLAPGGDTALQENTADAKQRQIRRSLKRLEEDLHGGILEVGEVREDEDFAAVMIKKTGGFDPGHLQIFPVALVKRGAVWFPAPVPASFENAVAGYTVPLRKRLGELEKWMLRERVLSLEKLISDSVERTRLSIQRNIAGENLGGDDIGKITNLFMEACASGNQAAVLGFLGGLSDPLPTDWSERIRASQRAVASPENEESLWRLIVSPEVVREQVNEQRSGKVGLVTIACLDPARGDKAVTLGKIEILHFEFSKDSGGRWQINLPSSLLRGDAENLNSDDDLDVELLDSFPRELRKSDSAQPSENAAMARDAVLEALKSEGLRNLLTRVDFGRNNKEARIACAAAAEVWWSLHQPGSFRAPVKLGFREEGQLAAAAYQWFSPADPDQFELKTLYFKKVGEEWMWAPGVVPTNERKSQNLLSKWVEESAPEWRLSWRGALLANSLRIPAIDFDSRIEDIEVEGLVGRWLEALANRDLGKALGQAAWLGDEGDIPTKALRNLGYDLEDFRQGQGRLKGILRSRSWVAAHITTGEREGRKDFFVPVLTTPGGARILPEIDILADGNRTRNFLNQVSFDQLRKFSDEERTEELEVLFREFERGIEGGD